MATIEGVRALALSLPRSYEVLVRDRVKFRVGRIVFLAFSLASDPEKYLMPRPSDLRYNWAEARLDAIDDAETRELVLDAWRMVVPKRVAAAFET